NIANDGKTLILRSDDAAGRNELAVMYQTEDGWSDPEYVGNYRFQLFRDHRGDYVYPDTVDYYTSDDGRVIAIQQTKQFSIDYGRLTSDAYVFIKNAEGKWIQHQVNQNGAEVMRNMLLCGDGTKLLWSPLQINPTGVPHYSEMK
ncbi:MAG: hypothetical protein C4527_28870, partial [Candidatus Omnitrophota bacterium]